MTPGCPFTYFWQVQPQSILFIIFQYWQLQGGPKRGYKYTKRGAKRLRQKERMANNIDKASSADFAWPAPN